MHDGVRVACCTNALYFNKVDRLVAAAAAAVKLQTDFINSSNEVEHMHIACARANT